jgi:hypothetical protein
MTDAVKFRREFSRWLILLTLNNSRPVGNSDSNILTVVKSEFQDFTLTEFRREIDYLAERQLVGVTLPVRSSDPWRCELTRLGVDVAEYTVPIEPGIARPDW